MSFAELVSNVDRHGWSLSQRTGSVVEPSCGYVVPFRPDRWWSVYERRLRSDTVKLYVYACAEDFAADERLLLYATKHKDHYVLGLATLLNRIDHAFELAAADGNHAVYQAPDLRAVNRNHFGEAS